MTSRRLDALEELRHALRVEAPAEELLRSAAEVAAAAFGDYCLADMIDRRGNVSRIAIVHPDESRLVKLVVALELARSMSNPRVARLLAMATGEMTPKVSAALRARALSDVVLLAGSSVCSYMASVVCASGSPIAVLTMARSHATPPYRNDDRAFLDAIAEWSGLAIENALRREPRASDSPPALSARPPRLRANTR